MDVFGIYGYQQAQASTTEQFLIYKGTAKKLANGEPFIAITAHQFTPDEIGEQIVGDGEVFWTIEEEEKNKWTLVQQAFRGNTDKATITTDSEDGPILDETSF